MKQDRHYLPTVAELIDRLSILQLKEWHTPELAGMYADDMERIRSDLGSLLSGTGPVLLHAVVILAEANALIWTCEQRFRSGELSEAEAPRLIRTLNGVRARACNLIASELGEERRERKVDCIAADLQQYEPSLFKANGVKP